MKTTINIADSLLREAKQVAAEERTTLRGLVEEGLRLVIAAHKKSGDFRLRRACFRGEGFQPGVSLEDWDQVRDLIYRGRGA